MASTEPGGGGPATVDDAVDDVLLGALDAELVRTMRAPPGQAQAPYYLSYHVEDRDRQTLVVRRGALVTDLQVRLRGLQVMARVGSPHRDNTNPSSVPVQGSDEPMLPFRPLALDDKPAVLQHQIWSATHPILGRAQRQFARLAANPDAQTEAAQEQADFSAAPAHRSIEPRATASLDTEAWLPHLKTLSALLGEPAEIEVGTVTLEAGVITATFVDSEGARLRESRPWARIELVASTTAPDGESLQLHRSTDVNGPARLPAFDQLRTQAQSLRDDLLALRQAPAGEPYRGPVLLDGYAAARFVPEVLGPNVAGDRHRWPNTPPDFRSALGARVLPDFIDIIDDPTLATFEGVDLAGHYRWDREGQPAARVSIVDRGVLRGFLMGRSPIAEFPHSNGHARLHTFFGWASAVGLSNTLLITRRPEPASALRQRLIEAARAQNLPYGLRIEGLGMPLGDMFSPAEPFRIPAERVWQVFVDGRPDALVRGLDLVGRPLDALSRVVATGDDPKVASRRFGLDPVEESLASVSPSLLLGELELVRREETEHRPPILPRPTPSVRF